MAPRRCPCGTGLPYAGCCGRLHDGTATAGTAEQLMRSRYSAFAVGDPAYLLATWHPSTRPPSLELDPTVRWTGLDVLATTDGGLLAAEGRLVPAAFAAVTRKVYGVPIVRLGTLHVSVPLVVHVRRTSSTAVTV